MTNAVSPRERTPHMPPRCEPVIAWSYRTNAGRAEHVAKIERLVLKYQPSRWKRVLLRLRWFLSR